MALGRADGLQPSWATIPRALLGKGDGFSRGFFAPPQHYHHPVLDAGARRKHAGAVCFSPSSWQGASSQIIHKFLGEAGM